jgi:hypothetical protein
MGVIFLPLCPLFNANLAIFGCACILIASSSQIINFWNKLVLACLEIDKGIGKKTCHNGTSVYQQRNNVMGFD